MVTKRPLIKEKLYVIKELSRDKPLTYSLTQYPRKSRRTASEVAAAR